VTKRWVVLLLTSACGTTLNASDYTSTCDADSQCVRVPVGDVCSCNFYCVGINQSSYNQWLSDLERIGPCRNPCVDGGTASCGADIGTQCSAGVCTTYTLSDAGPE
jgi:hypothetical protein